jgi:cell division septum initiation protein DivIVA
LALDRTSIEKGDFPVSRRGYEPAAVDAHLKALADRFEEVARASPHEALASTASEQVRGIVAAAESSAAEIRSAAEQQARESARQAAADAERVRGEATRRAEECVAKVRAATQLMLERLDAMEGELEGLLVSLRSGGEAMPAAPAAEQEAPAPEQEAPAPEQEAPAAVDAPTAGDEEKARLIALEMALSGKSREEADSYLAGEFKLDDRAKLLDEIYAKIGEIER